MLGYIPDPYPDELIYSVWARFGEHVHYPCLSGVLEDLFGDRKIKPTVDLPCNLLQFCNNLPPGAELDIDTIIDKHTLLPYYRPFLSRERYRAIRQQMIDGSAYGIHRRMGITRSNILRPVYLKYCPRCLEEDKATFGESYWHRLHQAPGVQICLAHEVFLEQSPFRVQSSLNQRGCVPADWITDPAPPREASSSPFYSQLKEIARNISYLLNHPHLPSDPQFARKQYHALLAKQKYQTLTGRIKARLFVADFLTYYSPSMLTLVGCRNDCRQVMSNNWLMNVVNANDSWHPLYHVLILLFLKSSVQQFFHKSLDDALAPFGQGPWLCLNPVCPQYKQACIWRCQIRHSSHQRGYSGSFTCACGFTYTCIVSEAVPYDSYHYNTILAYGQLWESTLRKLWLDRQLTLAQIAQRLGVSVHTIDRKANALDLPHRKKTWERKRKTPCETEIAMYRERLLETLAAFPNEGREVLAQRSQGAYAWLRKYDRAWFDAHLPPCKTSQLGSGKWLESSKRYPSGGGRKVSQQEWAERDRAISEAIYERAKELIEAPGWPQKVTLRKLRQSIVSFPDRPKNSALLPLTGKALKEVLESTEQFVIRRIEWVARQYLLERKPLPQWKLVWKAGANRHKNQPLVQAAIQEAIYKLATMN